ncbi:hypothetical protein ACU8KO_002549 [Vibrio alginolyticus]
MNDISTKEPLLFSEYPVSASKLKTAKNICVSMGLATAASVVFLAAKSLLFAPPEVLNVRAEPSFCPGSLKVALKEEHNAILSCSTAVSGSGNVESIVINRLSAVADDDVYKIVAVLETDNERDPTVVASLPSLAETDLLKEFVTNALNKSDTDIGDSASYYWGIGSSSKTNLGLIDALIDSGVTNPTTRVNDTIMRDIASSYTNTKIVNETLKPREETASVKFEKPISVVVNQKGKGQCADMGELSAANCEMAHELIAFSESYVIKIMMMLMVMGAIFYSVVHPSLVMFAMSTFAVLLLANLPAVIRAVLLSGA